MKSDIVIIGGGAAGLMAAIGAAEALAATETGGTVTLLEKMQKPARKVMISGKGRCNFTNVKDWDDFSGHICANAPFASPAWHNLTPEGLIRLFKANGLSAVVERGDRAFPASHMAGDVVDTLVRTAKLYGVKVLTGCEVHTVEAGPRGFKVDFTRTVIKEFGARRDDFRAGRREPPKRTETVVTEDTYTAAKLIIATGGLSYPGTGSTGDGYRWAEAFGHTVGTLFPSLTALVPKGYKDLSGDGTAEEVRRPVFRSGKQRRIEDKVRPLPEGYPQLPGHIERIVPLSRLGSLLEGTGLDNVQLTLHINGEPVQEVFGDLEFTDGGLEGPLGFQASRRAVRALMSGSRVSVTLDLKPAVPAEQLDADVHARWEEVLADSRSEGAPFQRLFRILLGKLVPWGLTLGFLQCNPDVSIDTLAARLKAWTLEIEGFVGFERAVVTAGGVSTDEVIAKTMESKQQPGLYIAGELLDLDCDTGGYNLHTAFSTGYLAGQSAARAL